MLDQVQAVPCGIAPEDAVDCSDCSVEVVVIGSSGHGIPQLIKLDQDLCPVAGLGFAEVSDVENLVEKISNTNHLIMHMVQTFFQTDYGKM